MCSKFICAMVLAGAVVAAPLLAQDDAATENDPRRLYILCVAKMRSAPLEAYSPCKRFLEQTSDDGTPQVKYVRAWIARYEKVLPYVEFLQHLTTDTKRRCSGKPRLSIPAPARWSQTYSDP